MGLIDRAVFPRDKLCGGLLTGRSRRAINAIFQTDLPQDLALVRDCASFHLASGPLATLTDVPPMALTMRRDFDGWLREQALAAGALDFGGQGLRDIDTDARSLTLASGDTLRFGAMIGADGVKSPTARALFGRAFDPARIGFALEIEAPPSDAPLRIDLDAAHWGYGWSFPKAHSTTIGIGGWQARNPDLKSQMAAYLARLGLDPGAHRIKGHHLPFGDFRRQPGRGAVVLAGDAAGLVDPITGEGIAYALESGALAARAAVAALARGKPDSALTIYLDSLRPALRELAHARRLRLLMFHPATAPTFHRGFARSRQMTRDFMHLLAGDIGYPQVMGRLTLRLPRLAAMALTGR